MTTRSLPSAPRPMALAIHSLLLVGSLALSGSALAKSVTWDDIANDHLSTENVLQYGMGPHAQRWSPLAQVNADNVFKLTPAWSYSFGDEKQRGQESQAIIHDGVVYVTGSYSRVFALDAKTGKRLWTYNHRLPDDIRPCCDVVNRGAAIYGDKIYFGTLDARVVALNKDTGKVVWNKKFGDHAAGYTMTGAPTIVKDGKSGKVLLIHGSSGDEFGVVGRLFARDPDTGKPSASPEHFAAFLPRIKQASGAVLNIATGGSAVMSLEERLAPAMATEPEMCSLNMGTMNFALYQAVARVTDWKHDWEKPFLEDTDDLVFKNTPRDIAAILRQIGQARGARFEFECYDVGHLYTAAHFLDRGLIRQPIFLQMIFGILGGIGAELRNLHFMYETAKSLFGDSFEWSVLAAGRNQFNFATQALLLGGNVRVGLEDNLFISKGKLAESNAQQVMKIRGIAEALGRPVATPDETRARLGLKGSHDVRVR